METAKEYWKQRFGEAPQGDAEKLAVAMMAEYGESYARIQIEKDRERLKCQVMTLDVGYVDLESFDLTPIILD